MNGSTHTNIEPLAARCFRLSRLKLLGTSLSAAIAMLLSSAALAHAEPRPDARAVSFEGTREYVVLYRKGVDLDARLSGEKTRGNEVEKRFTSSINGALLELAAEDVNRLQGDDRVLAIGRDGRVSIAGTVEANRSAPSWGLDRIDQRNLPLNGQISTAVRGSGVEAYVIDTGIRLGHREFTGRINPEGFALGGSRADCNGHGTHVAGTVAGATFGVAPLARLTSVRVLDCNGYGRWSDVVAGIDWMIRDHLQNEPAVANMSLGGARSDGDVVNIAVQRAVEDGIVMVVAAGNDRHEACSYSPASAVSAITVGSTNRSDQMSSFSNYGSCVDIFAPGSGIRSASIDSNTASEVMDGTSMASPHVAGAAALLISSQPRLNPLEVAQRLSSSATPNRISSLGSCSPNQLLYAGSGAPLPQPGLERPTNDLFANRSTISSPGVVQGSNHCGMHELNEPGHYVGSNGPWDANASIWYEWTAPSSGRITLRTAGTSFKHMLSIYTGSDLRSLDRVASGSGTSQDINLSTGVVGGTSYAIAIDRWIWDTALISSPTGTTRISLDFQPRPTVANDHFRNASPIVGPISINGSNRGATAEPMEPPHHGVQAKGSVWYQWSAPENGTLNMETSGSSFDTVMAAYSGETIESLVSLTSDDDSGGGTASRISLPVFEGRIYYIAIDGYGGSEGAISLTGDFVTSAGDDSNQPPTVWIPRPFLMDHPPRRTYSRSAFFLFDGSGWLAPARFACRLDGQAWRACRSSIRFRGLTPGNHIVRVKQTFGQSESSPTAFRWRVLRRKR